MVTKPKCDFGDLRSLDPQQLFAVLHKSKYEPFQSEAHYRTWFIDEALIPILSLFWPGRSITKIWRERQLPHGNCRIDVLVILEGGKIIGFELKSRNKKAPQTGTHSAILGIGQALLYQDILTAFHQRFVPVFLVADAVSKEVAGVIWRHGLRIGLIEANPRNIFTVSAHHIHAKVN